MSQNPRGDSGTDRDDLLVKTDPTSGRSVSARLIVMLSRGLTITCVFALSNRPEYLAYGVSLEYNNCWLPCILRDPMDGWMDR